MRRRRSQPWKKEHLAVYVGCGAVGIYIFAQAFAAAARGGLFQSLGILALVAISLWSVVHFVHLSGRYYHRFRSLQSHRHMQNSTVTNSLLDVTQSMSQESPSTNDLLLNNQLSSKEKLLALVQR